jgi:hypothetical protein
VPEGLLPFFELLEPEYPVVATDPNLRLLRILNEGGTWSSDTIIPTYVRPQALLYQGLKEF